MTTNKRREKKEQDICHDCGEIKTVFSNIEFTGYGIPVKKRCSNCIVLEKLSKL